MNVESLDDEIVKETLAAICKYEGDLRKAEKELTKHLDQKKAAAAGSESTGEGATGDDKDLLH